MIAPSVTETQVFTGLRAFLLLIVAAGVEVVQTQQNRVAEPVGPDFIVMTPSNRVRLATNQDTWDRTGANPVAKLIDHDTQFDMQLDIHGPNGSDTASVIAATFADDFGRDALAPHGIAPLFASDGHQSPFKNAEDQYENRWVMTVAMQIRPNVSTAAQFADRLAPVINPALGG